MDKKSIRKTYKEIRNNISEEDRKAWNESAANKVLNLKEFKEANDIFAFVSFGSEIDTTPIIRKALEEGKNVYIPVTEKGAKMMKLTKLKSLESLVLGHYGILSPKEEDLDFVDPNIVDFVLVPGLAFDKEGYRTGYGGGYYDKFFDSLEKSPVKVGYCYKVQLVDKLDHDEFDIPVDFIITN